MSKIIGIVPHKSNDINLNNLATKIFTVGGIDITTNLQPTRFFSRVSPSFSKLYTLDDLPTPVGAINNTQTSTNTVLKFNRSNPKYFAKFGSLLELVRVSLDSIILTYPASINSKSNVLGRTGNNILNVGYFPFDNTTTFSANVSYFSNPFGIYFLDNYGFQYEDSRINQIRNLTLNYLSYELVVDNVAYPILEFFPSKTESNDFIQLKVEGRPFDLGNISKEFYIKPIESEIQKFYNSIDEFEAYLLDRDTDFSAIFDTVKFVDGGVSIDYQIKFQFPRLDLYNIDVTTRNYDIYVHDLVEFATEYDEIYGNILMRHLVPENIQSVTLESESSVFPAYGKINKLLIVYGRELDKINRYIENIKFFNTVTYDGKDNVPDSLVNNLAASLGWSVLEQEGLDPDFYKLLIINSWYIFQSKGTRSAIEYILSFIGIPLEIVDFNEYIIRAKKPIDVEKLKFYYSLFSNNFDFSTLPIDDEGYPVYPLETPLDYFQILGNSDNGMAYFYKWYNLLPLNFTGTSVSYSGESISVRTLFEQDFNGTGNTLGYTIINDKSLENFCYNSSGSTITDPYPTPILDECGCPLPISDKSLEICVEPIDLTTGCTNIILDIYYDCISATGATLFINVFGGTSPIVLSGATDGQSVLSGETINVIAIDVNGCTSDVYQVYIDCTDPCLGTFIDVELDYDCILDEFSQNTGQAILTVVASGGVAPYTIIGTQSGDTVNDAEVVVIEVIDSEGCSSGLVGITIDCEPPAVVACGNIGLSLTLETTNIEPQFYTAKVTATYGITGLPSGLFIDTVTMTSIGNGGDNAYLIGTPVITVFTTPSGADTLELDFTSTIPLETPNNISIELTIDIVLSNGCTYNTSSVLTVNPKKLGNADFDDMILP